MNILLLTTLESEEMHRLKDEAEKLGHVCDLVHLGNLSYAIKEGVITIDGITDKNPDVVIAKGITKNKAVIVALLKEFRKKGIKVFDNNYSNHQYTINKVADIMKLALHGIPIPDTHHVSDFTKYYEIAESLNYPVVVKLIGTGKGRGVYKADNKDELHNIISEAENVAEKTASRYIIQEFIPYVHDLRVLVIGEKCFVMKRIPGENEFRANFSLGGSVELFDLDAEGIDLARRALASVDMSVAGVDILITADNKRYILEVNHTPGFIGMEQATNENIAKIYLEHAIASAE